MTSRGWIRFVDELPDCCAVERLKMPRPESVELGATGQFSGLMWSLGLDDWRISVDASWYGAEDELQAAVASHLSRPLKDFAEAAQVLAQHGVHLDDELSAPLGQQDVVVARVGSPWAHASGRQLIQSGADLLEAADAEAGDLEMLVSPLVAAEESSNELWCQEVIDQVSDASFTDVVILLRAVAVTPTARGWGLGAWAAAQSVALFDSGNSMVATLASPISRRDVFPLSGALDRDMTPAELTSWDAEQERLRRHWRTELGLTPLSADPNVLYGHTSRINEPMERSLARWRV